MTLPTPERAQGWAGRMIVDRTGATVGPCVQIFRDDDTGLPEWASARMGDLVVVLPLAGAVEDGDQIRIAVRRDDVLLAPPVADQRRITEREEAALYRHFGIDFSREGSATVLPAAATAQGKPGRPGLHLVPRPPDPPSVCRAGPNPPSGRAPVWRPA